MSSNDFELREDFANYSKKCDLDEKIPSNFYPFYLGSCFNWMNLYVSSMHKFYAQYRNKYYSEEEFASATNDYSQIQKRKKILFPLKKFLKSQLSLKMLKAKLPLLLLQKLKQSLKKIRRLYLILYILKKLFYLLHQKMIQLKALISKD